MSVRNSHQTFLVFSMASDVIASSTDAGGSGALCVNSGGAGVESDKLRNELNMLWGFLGGDPTDCLGLPLLDETWVESKLLSQKGSSC